MYLKSRSSHTTLFSDASLYQAYNFVRRLETGTVLPSGRALSCSYDAAGRTSAIGSAPAGGSPGNLASYSYAGNYLAAAAYGNGTSESRSYDAFGRLSALALGKADASKVRDWAFAYDKA